LQAERGVYGINPRTKQFIDSTVRDASARLEFGLALWPTVQLFSYAAYFAQDEFRRVLPLASRVHRAVRAEVLQFQVSQSIVAFLTVDVMNHFVPQKFAAKVTLHHKTMHENRPTVDCCRGVTARHAANYSTSPFSKKGLAL